MHVFDQFHKYFSKWIQAGFLVYDMGGIEQMELESWYFDDDLNNLYIKVILTVIND